jgi:Uma2 family endonuclease
MAELAEKLLTFDEFASLRLPGRYELVDGRLEELVAPRPLHGWTSFQFCAAFGAYLKQHDPGGYPGSEVDIPTVPFHGRRPDVVYYSPGDRNRLDLRANRVLGVPTLVVEVLSEDDEERDLVVKREEYAQAGIPHYWILDPIRQYVLTLVLREGRYEMAGEFGRGDVLSSNLFPGLAIPVADLFPAEP